MSLKKFSTALLLTTFLIFACNVDRETSVKESKKGPNATLTETGELQAVKSTVVQMPSFNWAYGRPKIVRLEGEGTNVKKGDVVGQIDTAGVVREMGQKEADLAMGQADLNKLLVEHENQIKAQEADQEIAKAALKQAQVNMERVKFESLAKKEVRQLELEIAELAYQQILKKMKHNQIIQQETLRIQKEKIKQIVSAINMAKRTKDMFTLRAPANGMIEYKKRGWRSREKIKVGDELHPGEALIGLPDLTRMKVLTMVNETDISKIKLGQKAAVKLDAFPKVLFDGEIIYVSKTCRLKERDSKIKIFDVEILLEKSDPILRPGMTVSCEILVKNEIVSTGKENKGHKAVING
jgi:HlyD family secretion protein